MKSLPAGLGTWIGEGGAKLSGGQAKRLAVARIMLRDAPVVVLDEPGEGLDAVTADALQAALLKALHGRTLLLITHRPAGHARMGRTVALEQGKISTAQEARRPGIA